MVKALVEVVLVVVVVFYSISSSRSSGPIQQFSVAIQSLHMVYGTKIALKCEIQFYNNNIISIFSPLCYNVIILLDIY